MSQWLPHVILAAFNVINVFIDAYKIKKLNKTIRHGVNFGAYAAVVYLLIHWTQSYFIVVPAFFGRQICFDILLNIRRGLAWDYVSVDNPPKAVMDRLEIWVFGRKRAGAFANLLYAVLWVASVIIQSKL